MFLDPWLLVPAVTWMLLCYYSKLPRLRAERASRLGLAVPFACCLLGPLSLFPSVAKPQPHQIRAVCQNGMRQIQLAMLNYKSSYGQFPEATEIDTSGKPMHSWRVRLLPFLEEQALYDQYDFSQPWDSPTNQKLLDQMPACYRCPCSEETNRTHYKLVVGPGTLHDGGERTFKRILDGSSNTISMIEDGQNPVEWTRPADLSIEEAIAALAPEDLTNLPHVSGDLFDTVYAPGVAAFFDGSVKACGNFSGSDPKLLRNMLEINDGNLVDEDQFVGMESHVVPKYRQRVAAIVFLIMMIYPWVWVLSRNQG